MKISLSTFVPSSTQRAFDLSIDIDTHLESMAHSGERAVDGVASGLIALGESVTWKARHFGITWTMTSTITAWDRPHSFVDEQAKGPFKMFRHLHRFEPEGDGTRMIDEIDYTAPFGPIGSAVDRMVLNRYLQRLIVARNDFIVTEAAKRS
jgi:ligand-binding SRPBCC domain-containing protein